MDDGRRLMAEKHDDGELQHALELVETLVASVDADAAPDGLLAAQFDLGLAWVHFPVGLGGLGLRPSLQSVVDGRLRDAGWPEPASRNIIGYGMVAPTLVAHGTPWQQRRFIRPLFTGEEIWCQLFSEPGAGSDVASIAARAAADGDRWVVSGQKVWTTLAHTSQFGLLLARTDPDLPKHEGITAFVVDMRAEGVEVRPLVQMTGQAEFNEVFLTEVVIPDTWRLGGRGDGWRVAVTTLMNERVVVGNRVPARRRSRIREAIDAWQGTPQRSLHRDRLMRLWVDAEVLRLTNLRAAQLRALGTPGPEGSLGKIASGVLNKRLSEFTVDVLGARAMLKSTGYPLTRREGQQPYDDPVDVFLRARAASIEGGTTEIAKNIVAERMLGLPREPRGDKGAPWRQGMAGPERIAALSSAGEKGMG